jgi:hypothetical protein
MKLNPNIPPPNGFVFKDTDGTVFRAATMRALVRRVLTYRTRTGGKTNDLEQEIQTQLCSVIPEHCHGEGSPQAIHREKLAVKQTLRGRMAGYLGTLARVDSPKKVAQPLAAERIRVCRGCPQRAAITGGCGGCRKNAELLRKKCLGGSTPISPDLGGCSILGCDLAVAVHLREPPVQTEGLPVFCWRRMP